MLLYCKIEVAAYAEAANICQQVKKQQANMNQNTFVIRTSLTFLVSLRTFVDMGVAL